MRWGAASVSTESLRWVRPLQGIVALLGEEIVDFEIAGVRSGAATIGHRFHHPGIITLGGAHDYAEKLRACHVVLDPAERRRLIAEGAAKAAAAAGLALVEDEGLLAENAGLTEWPVALLGGFDPAFLDVPREVIQLTMRTNQKYFALNSSPAFAGEGDHAQHGGGASSDLAPNFICVANIEAADGGAAIVAGNERVLSARLTDAKFFWEQDLKIPLEEQAAKLDQIVFHEKLGTVADKVERVAKLARWLVEEGIVGAAADRSIPSRGATPKSLSPRGRGQGEGVPSQGLSSVAEPPHPDPLPTGERERIAALAETAARLCKADLVTGLVGEFPELQGVIGGHLARAQGQPPEVADAIRDHYKPVGQGDEVPTAPVTVAVSLADKLDTIVGFFSIDERPSGSRDPFALRRAAIASASLISMNRSRASILDLIERAFVPLRWLICLRQIELTKQERDDILCQLLGAREIVFDFLNSTNYDVRADGRILILAGNVDKQPFLGLVPLEKVKMAVENFLHRPPQGPAARGRRPPRSDRRRLRAGRRGRSRPAARPGEGAAGVRRDARGRRPPRRLQARRQHPEEGGLGRLSLSPGGRGLG